MDDLSRGLVAGIIGGRTEMPQLAGDQAGQRIVAACTEEPCFRQRRSMVGQPRGAKTGEDAEGKIERSHDDLCGQTHQPGRDAKVGDEPESIWRKCRCDAGDEGFEIGLGEAVEKEVRDDKVVRPGGREGERAGVVSFKAHGIGFAAPAQESEHGCAGVYGVGVDARVRCQKGREETAVAVAYHEGFFAMEERREKVQAAAFEGAAEGKVFKPAVRACDGIEVGLGVHRRRKAARNRGVSSTRSAAARRESGAISWRRWCSISSRAAERAAASGIGHGAR